MSTYNDLCFSADFNHSPLDCSVIGWKLGTTRKQVGPLLKTTWHQGAPFNDLCDGHSAGCAPVAMAQLMYYYQYPQTLSYNGYTFHGIRFLKKTIPVPIRLNCLNLSE